MAWRIGKSSTEPLGLEWSDGGTSGHVSLDVDIKSDPSREMDGLLCAAAPGLMLHGGDVFIEGTVSRKILRNLTEWCAAWHDWNPEVYKPVHWIPETITDPCDVPPENTAWFAWSGSLRSTHVLARHLAGTIPMPYAINGVIRIWGLHPQEYGDPQTMLADDRAVFEKLGIPFQIVTMRRSGKPIPPEIGDAPYAASALHAIAGKNGTGVLARNWSWPSQWLRPRPGPIISDLWSGGATSIHIEGGTAGPSEMVQDLINYPELFARVSNCTTRPRHEEPCGTCTACMLLALASGPHARYKKPRCTDIATMRLDNAVHIADAESLLHHAPHLEPIERRRLRHRLKRRQVSHHARETLNWIASATRLRPAWPR